MKEMHTQGVYDQARLALLVSLTPSAPNSKAPVEKGRHRRHSVIAHHQRVPKLPMTNCGLPAHDPRLL